MATSRKTTRTPQEDTQIALIASDVNYIKGDVQEIKSTLKSSYVTTDQFEPVKKIVYGLVGLILVAVVGALLALVVKK